MEIGHEFVIRLADGYSTQSKTTNKFWLVLNVICIIALVAHTDENGLLELPFTLGKVSKPDFYSISCALISIVTIAFSAAQTQTFRTRVLIQKAIDDLPEEQKFIGSIHIQDFFDSIISPTYLRVASISQFLQGKSQFLGDNKHNRWVQNLALALYYLLKIATFGLLYLLPFYTLIHCWKNIQHSTETTSFSFPHMILLTLIFMAGISMTILFFGDLKNLYRVTKRISHKI